MSNNNSNETGCLNNSVLKIGSIGLIVGLILAFIPIVQAFFDSRQQGQVDATSIAIQAEQLDVMIEQATLEAIQSSGFENNEAATRVEERLIELQGTSTTLEISKLEGTIVALEQQNNKQSVVPTNVPVPTPEMSSPIASANTPIPQPIIDEYEIIVDANKEQNQTGIYISPGDIVTIEFLNGKWRAGPLPTWPFYGPSGDPQVPSKETFPVQEKSIMGLVGGISNQQPFWIGTGIQFESSKSGELWLGANDDDFSDNDGRLIVVVTLRK